MTAFGSAVHALDVASRACTEYALLPSAISTLAASPWGLLCGLQSGEIAIVREGQVVRSWDTGRGPVRSLSVAQSTLVSSHERRSETDVWTMPEGARVATVDYRIGQVFVVALAPDARRLAIGANSAHVYVCDLASPRKPSLVLRGRSRCIYGLHWIDEDRLAAVPFGRSVDVWSVEGGTKLANLRGRPRDGHQPFSISESRLAHHGDRVAAAGLDQVVRIYSLASHEHLAVGKGHEAPVHGLVFVDARHILSVSGDRRALLWECP